MGDAVEPADRDRGLAPLGARALLGKVAGERGGLSAAGHAAGRHRLYPAPLVRPEGAPRAPPRRHSRHCPCVSLDRRRLGLRGHGVSVDGALDAAVDRGRRPPARGCRGDTRRQSVLGVRDDHPAVDPARDRRRDDPFFRPRARRIRCDDHLRFKHPGRNPDAAGGDLYAPAGARRRSRRVPADARLDF